MKSRRIFAAVMAPVVAVSAMAMVASAESAAANEKVNEKQTEVKIKASKKYGSLNVKQIQGTATDGSVEFAADDVISATVTAPEGTDTSKWQIAFSGFTSAWGGWSAVNSAEGTLTFTATVADIMKANSIDDISGFGGFSLQVWHVAEEDGNAGDNEEGEEVTIGYELKVTAAASSGEESSDSSTSSEESSDTSDESSSDVSSDDSSTPADDSSTPADDSSTPADDSSTPADDSSTPADDSSTPADDSSETAKPTVIESKLTVGTEVVEGKAVEDIALVKDGKKYAWKDVESVTFKAEKSFSVQYNVKAGAVDGDAKKTVFVKGKDTLAKANIDSEWGTSWTLDAADLAAINEAETPNVKLVAKEAGTEITAAVTVKAGATGEDVKKPDADKPDNKPTGIALAAAPVILAGAAVAAVAIVNKKRK